METSMQFRRNSLRAVLITPTLLLLAIAAQLPGQTERKITKLADGVYAIQHQTFSGNTTVIIGERQVFVVDTCLQPSSAREDIAQIRQWTDKPVSFVLNTHFHNDHNLGNKTYMDAFPALTIIAHVETKKQLDLLLPGRAGRDEKDIARLQKMLETGKTEDGQTLDADDKTAVEASLARRIPALEELKNSGFQNATLTFDHDFTIDIGNREVQIKFLGRGNTIGDAVVYLPKEKIVVAGDLVVYPVPYMLDGYPTEWISTLQNMAQLDADTIVPGHGPILHDKAYLYLIRDLLQSAVDQMRAKLRQIGPACDHSLDDVKGAVDLTSFQQRFAGHDKNLAAEFDDEAAHLVKIVFAEASLR